MALKNSSFVSDIKQISLCPLQEKESQLKATKAQLEVASSFLVFLWNSLGEDFF